MSNALRFRIWVPVLAGALALLCWIDVRRGRHVEAVTSLGGVAQLAGTPRHNSLIAPGYSTQGYQWLLQTQRMFANHTWRVRHIDYENAPYGRDVDAASPYRWWLGFVAWCEHEMTGRPLSASVERAALVADPLLHLLLLITAAGFVAWRFGPLAAAVLCVGIATLFPFSARFLPGTPGDLGLSQIAAFWSVLLIGSGVAGAKDERRRRWWFAAAGVVAGGAVWLSPARGFPVVIGLGLGSLLAAWCRRPESNASGTVSPLPWRWWSFAGGFAVLVAYFVEFYPAHLASWHLRAVHPLYGIAWLGIGEIAAQGSAWIEERRMQWTWRRVASLVSAVIGVGSLPVVIWRMHEAGFLAANLSGFRLTDLPGSPLAPSFSAWAGQPGSGTAIATVLLPLILIVPAVVWISRRRTPPDVRAFLVSSIGPIVAVGVLACRQLAWWGEVDAILLVLLVAGAAAAASSGSIARRLWPALACVVCLPGLLQLEPHAFAGRLDAPTESEIFELVERDLAGWLTAHAGPQHVVFIAPPDETTALAYFGAGKGIGTLSWQNTDGLQAAVRILSASTPEEAKTLIDRRGITHIIMPSWDPYIDELARMGMGEIQGTFLERIHAWQVPNWLRPAPYQLPVIGGFEQQSITMFEVVDAQSDPIALSRTAEYFVDIGKREQAAMVAHALRRYPADMNAWIVRAEIAGEIGDQRELRTALGILTPYVKGRRDRRLAWDMRVALAVVLARARQTDLARREVQLCVAQASTADLRALTTGSLFRLMVLSRAFQLPFRDPALHALALELLPPEARPRV